MHEKESPLSEGCYTLKNYTTGFWIQNRVFFFKKYEGLFVFIQLKQLRVHQ